MRRLTSILIGLLLCSFVISFEPGTVEGQFATNTPSGNGGGFQVPTEAGDTGSSNGFSFATNTPDGPTNTPTNTATASNTPSPTATASHTPTATYTPSDTPTPTATPNGPFSYPDGVNALTGLAFPNEEARARRNLIVKISNYPPIVRPQHGVNQADIVYEYEAEGGVTRFAAIFRSNAPEYVGSVRSARLADIELATMYRALLAYSGTSEPIQHLLTTPPFFEYQIISPLVGHGENQVNDCSETPFCRNDALRENGVPREHTLFANTQRIWDEATRQNTNTGYIAFGFAFNDFPDAGGEAANDIHIEWWGQTNARWQYDPDSGHYLRFTDGVPHYDAADGEQLWVDNLIIVEVPYIDRPDLFPEGATYTSLGIELWGQGFAYVLRDGLYYRGYWRRNENMAAGQALQVIYGNNTPIMLKPGRTWVTLVRGLGNANISEEYTDLAATATLMALTPSPTPLDVESDD
jgi:hypothetical protein